jgi:hypothetical protein
VAELASIAAQCLASVQAYDTAVADDEKLSVAQLKFDDILSSPSLEAAAKKIDNLAKNRELDPTLMLLITKAWAAAKESTMMKEEVSTKSLHCQNLFVYLCTESAQFLLHYREKDADMYSLHNWQTDTECLW